ncbi:extracellular solute-binding protein [Sinomonas notoginsengisoli]|uniref:sugar ABC transporter substrate-binding protein n=1 Tax=Sinomonas notoginsengisoli TaxID=1457311 RepID=UPI001F1BB12A|nr:sugar ABC transporter substrate-binding protein [Sinomonas notoginsengisoli]
MSTRRSKLSAAALSISVLVALTACNPAGSGGPAKPSGSSSSGGSGAFSKDLSGALKTSGFNPSDEVGKSRSDLATQSVSPATVSMDTTNFDAQKFSAQAASGQVPDLIQVDRSVVPTLADKGLIQPIDACYSLWGVTPDQQYYPAAVKSVTFNGKVYGVPQFFQTSMLIADKNVMQAAGVSTDQLDTSKPDQIVTAAQKMYKESGGKPSVIGFDGDLPGSADLWLQVFGGNAMDAQGKPTLDASNNVKALTWMKKLMDAQGGFAGIKSFKDSMDVFGNQNQYVKNQVGVQTWAQWYINVLSNTKSNVSVVGVPIKTLDGKAIGYAGGTALAIPTAAKNPSAACAWAIKATSQDAWKAAGDARAQTVQQKNSINTGLFTGSPAADKAVRDAHVKSSGSADFDQLISTSYSTLDNTASFGGSPAGQTIKDALSNAVAVALAGEKDPAGALKDAQDTALRAWQQTSAGKNG